MIESTDPTTRSTSPSPPRKKFKNNEIFSSYSSSKYIPEIGDSGKATTKRKRRTSDDEVQYPEPHAKVTKAASLSDSSDFAVDEDEYGQEVVDGHQITADIIAGAGEQEAKLEEDANAINVNRNEDDLLTPIVRPSEYEVEVPAHFHTFEERLRDEQKSKVRLNKLLAAINKSGISKITSKNPSTSSEEISQFTAVSCEGRLKRLLEASVGYKYSETVQTPTLPTPAQVTFSSPATSGSPIPDVIGSGDTTNQQAQPSSLAVATVQTPPKNSNALIAPQTSLHQFNSAVQDVSFQSTGSPALLPSTTSPPGQQALETNQLSPLMPNEMANKPPVHQQSVQPKTAHPSISLPTFSAPGASIAFSAPAVPSLSSSSVAPMVAFTANSFNPVAMPRVSNNQLPSIPQTINFSAGNPAPRFQFSAGVPVAAPGLMQPGNSMFTVGTANSGARKPPTLTARRRGRR